MRRRRTKKAAPRRRTTSRRRRRNPRRRRRAAPRRRRAAARRRNASSMPVVLVNPTRRRSTRRRNPSRRRTRRKRRRSGSYRVTGYSRRYPRIRNPTATWGGAFMTWLLGSVGGLAAGGMDWGADYIPLRAEAQAGILGGATLLSSLAVSKWADIRAGAGIAGGGAALCLNRIRQIVATSGTGAGTGATTSGAGRVYGGAGAVVRGGAGQVRRRETPTTMGAPHMRAPSFKQAQGTYPAQGRRFGPRSWVYDLPAGARAVYVSAHNLPRSR
jgi:hypothetical protein